LGFVFGIHSVWSLQVHVFNFTATDISRFWSILDFWRPFAFSVFLFWHPFGERDGLKRQKTLNEVEDDFSGPSKKWVNFPGPHRNQWFPSSPLTNLNYFSFSIFTLVCPRALLWLGMAARWRFRVSTTWTVQIFMPHFHVQTFSQQIRCHSNGWLWRFETWKNPALPLTFAYRLGFWFVVCYAATQLATPLHQNRIQVVRSNKVARKRLTESNGTPAKTRRILKLMWIFKISSWIVRLILIVGLTNSCSFFGQWYSSWNENDNYPDNI